MSNEPELNLEEQNSIFAEIDEGLSGSSFKYNIKELEINTDGTIDLPQPEERKTEESYPTRKEFIVVLKDDTQILSFENDMEELKLVESCYTLEDGSTVCSETPLREVTYSGTKSQVKTKFFKYYLTDEEAETLKNDFRVRSVDIPPEQKGIVAELFDSQIGNFSRVRNGKNNPYDLLQIVCQMISGSFVEGEQIYQVKDISGVNALLENATGKAFIYKKTRIVSGGFQGPVIFLYVKKNENNPFFGSFFAKGRTDSNQTIKGVSSGAEALVLNITYHFEKDYNWGLTRHSYYGNEQNPVIQNQYNYSLDGTGVDVVIFDSGIILNHPEFQDANGNSRVKTIDWFEAAGWPDTNIRMPPGSELYNINYNDATGHGTHVAATVAGKTFGWAKNSDIYVINAFGSMNWASAMNFTNEFAAALYLVKEWHKRKPIDPKTGFKRPTVMNHSWGYSSSYGLESSYLIGWHAKTQDNKCIFFNSQLSPTGIKSIFYKNQLYTGEIVQNLDLFTTPQINTLKNTSLSELINAMYSCFGTIFSPRDSYIAQGPSFSIPGTNFSNLTLGLYIGLPSTGNFLRVSEVDDMFEEAIQEGIHICMSAGNSSVNICNEDDPEYNNYAVIQSINWYNTAPYTYDPNTSTYIPTPENEVTINEITHYYNRKASPYAKNAIVVGAIDSLNKEESTNQNIELSPFINGNVFGLDTRVIFSNYGSGVDIWAAGTDIISASDSYESNAFSSYKESSQTYLFGYNLYPPNEYYGQIKLSGTSMACPQVCGVCALILQKYPNLTPIELKQKLIEYSLKDALLDGIETVNNQTLNYPIRNMNGQNLTFCFSDDCTNNSTTIKFNPPAARALFAYGVYNKNLNVLYSPFSSFVMQENISTTFSTNQVTFTWTFSKPPIHSHYDVYRSENENFGYEKLNSTPITVENYQDTTVIPGTIYYYRIYSVTTTGEAIQASTITVNFQNFNSLSKIIVYPVVYQKDTSGNIVKDENGLKIVEKSYKEVNINDDYTIITDIKDAE